MQLQLNPQELSLIGKIADASTQSNLRSFVVGGFVRDKLLGRSCNDIDIVCLGDAIELANACAARFHPSPKVSWFKNFGTAHFFADGFDVEFVGARKESYQRDSRNPVVEAGSLQDDQERRDFTINALAFELHAKSSRDEHPSVIDPFNGLKDLEQRIIRTPLSPNATFSDDPLRMLRAIRFASQLNFTIHSATLLGITDTAHRIAIISQERISDEFNKILLSDKPSIGLDLLYKTGLLKEIFPQLIELAGAEYVDGKGHKDNFYHTLQVVDNIAPFTNNLWLRWAALLHFIAKPATKKFEKGTGWTFHGHEVIGGRMVPKIFTKWKLPLNEPMRYVRKLVELHLRPISLTKENITDSAIRRLLFDAGEDLEDLMTLCEADITSKNESKLRRYRANFEMVRERLKAVEEKDKIRNWQPPITGEIIMRTFNLLPCRRIDKDCYPRSDSGWCD